MSNSVSIFFLLKIFNIQTREGSVISFMEVIWQVPFVNWLKVNIGGVVRGCFDLASCASIFKGRQSSFSAFRVHKLLLCQIYGSHLCIGACLEEGI